MIYNTTSSTSTQNAHKSPSFLRVTNDLEVDFSSPSVVVLPLPPHNNNHGGGGGGQEQHMMNGFTLFFDKKFIQEVLGINLSESYATTRRMKEAVNILFGYFRRVKTQSLCNSMVKTKKNTREVEALRHHEVHRVLYPSKICTLWMVGGPYYSFATTVSTQVLYARRNAIISSFKLRKEVDKVMRMTRSAATMRSKEEINNNIEICLKQKAIALE